MSGIQDSCCDTLSATPPPKSSVTDLLLQLVDDLKSPDCSPTEPTPTTPTVVAL